MGFTRPRRGFAARPLKVPNRRSDFANMYAMLPQVTGADERWAARLQGFDPFFDDLGRSLIIDDVNEVRELMKVSALERSVAFTFPSMPEIFHGTIMTRPGNRQSGPPLVLVDVAAAGLDTTHWTRGIPVNIGFFDGPEFVGCRTSFAGSVGQIMALIGPRILYRFPPLGRERRLVPRDTALIARFSLPGEGERVCWVREAGRASLRGSIEAGPMQRPGLAIDLTVTLPDGPRLSAAGVLARLRLREDQTRDIIIDLDVASPDDGARLAACGVEATRQATPPPQARSAS